MSIRARRRRTRCSPAVTTMLTTAATAQDRSELHVNRAAQPPKIDGVLDDQAWQQQSPLPLGDWISYNPLRGDTMSADLRTEVRIAYDERNIYFAFHCADPEP